MHYCNLPLKTNFITLANNGGTRVFFVVDVDIGFLDVRF